MTGAAAGDGAPPAPGETVDMSQVAGPRDVPVPADDDAPKKKKKKDKAAHEMTDIGSTEGAIAAADAAIKELGTKRGIETLFRSSYRVNMDLTTLADAKANIMISINGLIVSILIASIAPGMEKNPWLYVPTSLFLLGCLVSLVFAVLSARPRVQNVAVTPDEALRERKNLLFFGNFSHMTQGQYVDSLKQVVMDPNRTYEMMMKDIYGVGSVLQKKYRLLQASYGAFLVALVVGVLGFILVFGYTVFFDVGGAAVPTPQGTVPSAMPHTGILP
ncbi:hypothetical protein BSZ37_07400 [Rubrivirga marina]|uniref:Pycsar effector protein domain-containing protein n=2 Tax=Rubrivirga marina TaxID=1196024 RepID=A0A271IYJ1_9BACT|nr:hypothetical protein BSZ37_07400 [Rubrivirga marina]